MKFYLNLFTYFNKKTGFYILQRPQNTKTGKGTLSVYFFMITVLKKLSFNTCRDMLNTNQQADEDKDKD
jgi:hypothetical protein